MAKKITDNLATIYFVLRCKDEFLVEILKTTKSSRNKFEKSLTDWAESEASNVKIYEQPVRFCVMLEELTTCMASSTHTSGKKNTDVMAVSIKGPIAPTASGPQGMLTFKQLYGIYSDLVKELTDKYNFDDDTIFIERIEMVSYNERVLVNDFYQQNEPEEEQFIETEHDIKTQHDLEMRLKQLEKKVEELSMKLQRQASNDASKKKRQGQGNVWIGIK